MSARLEPLHDPADPRLAPFVALRARPHRAHPRWLVAESELAVRRLVEGGFAVAVGLVTPPRAERVAAWWPAEAPLLVCERAVLREVLGYDLHRGCVAAAARPDLAEVPWGAVRPRGLIVAAEALADPANVGAIARSGRAFGLDLLLLDPRGADPFTPRAVRAAMGHAFLLPVAVPRDLSAAVSEARRRLGAEVLAAVAVGAARDVASLPPPSGPRLLLVGHEGRGLSAELLAQADRRVTVPIAPDVDSLKVAAATAVLLHALRSPAP